MSIALMTEMNGITGITECNILPVSEDSILLTWPEKICVTQHQRILSIEEEIRSQLKEKIVESIVSYNALLIYYDLEKISFEQIHELLNKFLASSNLTEETKPSKVIEIPVYYGEEIALDIKHVAHACHLSIEEVITLHSKQTYRAFALGFTPGFCYLGSLNKQLILPRKSTPRLTVPKGAVAIAEQQTAIYPNSSPGGWHIIGQTPVPLYEKLNNQFFPKISVGQEVTFSPINKATFEQLSNQFNSDQFNSDQFNNKQPKRDSA